MQRCLNRRSCIEGSTWIKDVKLGYHPTGRFMIPKRILTSTSQMQNCITATDIKDVSMITSQERNQQVNERLLHRSHGMHRPHAKVFPQVTTCEPQNIVCSYICTCTPESEKGHPWIKTDVFSSNTHDSTECPNEPSDQHQCASWTCFYHRPKSRSRS